MENMEFSVALGYIWQLVSRTNKYIDETQPWVLAKDENHREKLASVMAHLAEVLRQTGIMLMPFLTVAPSKMFAQLALLMKLINLGKVYLQLVAFQLEQK